MRDSIAVAHYLLTNLSAAERAAARRQSQSCGSRLKDVPVPPHLPAVGSARFLSSGLRPASRRRIAFFFAGNVPDSTLPGFDARTDADLGAEAYSEGVRQLVWKHLRSAAGFRVVPRSATYADDWADAKVCLAPMGVGWGIRLLWAVAAGCVPLMASSRVAPWFDRALPWEQMAILGVPKQDLQRLPTTLAALPDGALEQKQRALWRFRMLVLWPPAGGLAYHVTLYEVCLRAAGLARRRGAVWGWDCAQLLPPSAVEEFPEVLQSPASPTARAFGARRDWGGTTGRHRDR